MSIVNVLILLFFDAYESLLHATDSKHYAPTYPNTMQYGRPQVQILVLSYLNHF